MRCRSRFDRQQEDLSSSKSSLAPSLYSSECVRPFFTHKDTPPTSTSSRPTCSKKHHSIPGPLCVGPKVPTTLWGESARHQEGFKGEDWDDMVRMKIRGPRRRWREKRERGRGQGWVDSMDGRTRWRTLDSTNVNSAPKGDSTPSLDPTTACELAPRPTQLKRSPIPRPIEEGAGSMDRARGEPGCGPCVVGFSFSHLISARGSASD